MAFILRRLPIIKRSFYSVIKLSSISDLSIAQKNVSDPTSEPQEEGLNETIRTKMSSSGSEYEGNGGGSVVEYAMKTMKGLEAEGKLKNKIRSMWSIRRHMGVVEKFCQNPKQVLGLSLAEFQRRVKVLQELEISLEDALVIAITYPFCLLFDSPTMFSMVSLLRKYGCYLPKHFLKNPYVFSLDVQYCESNLEQLKKTGLSSESIGNLIDLNPIMLTVPLSKKAEDFALHAQNYKSSSNILRLALKASLLKSGEEISLNEDFEEIVSFLNELRIDLSTLMQKCPEIFCASYSHLVKTYQFLSGSPLYCEKKQVTKLLSSHPHAFLQMNKSSFQESINGLSKIIDSNVKLYLLLQKSPTLFVDSASVCLERIDLLTKHQFSQKEIVDLLERAVFIFSDGKSSSNLEKKLHLLLSKNDISTTQVCKSAFILRAPVDKIQKRLFFIRFQNPNVLKQHSLNEIFLCNNHVFISDICGSSLKEYLKIIELVDAFPKTGRKK